MGKKNNKAKGKGTVVPSTPQQISQPLPDRIAYVEMLAEDRDDSSKIDSPAADKAPPHPADKRQLRTESREAITKRIEDLAAVFGRPAPPARAQQITQPTTRPNGC